MDYRELSLRGALLADIAKLKLPAKATAERLMLKVHYLPASIAFEQAREAIRSDAQSTDEEKAAAIKSKSEEDAGVADRRFTAEAFEQIVTAVMADGRETVDSCIAPEGVRVEAWLEAVAQVLVRVGAE